MTYCLQLLLGAVVQWLQCEVYFDTALAMSLKMLAMLQLSFVIKIPKETKISSSRYGRHYVGHRRDVRVKLKFSEHMYNYYLQKEKLSEVQVREHRGSSTAFGNYQII